MQQACKSEILSYRTKGVYLHIIIYYNTSGAKSDPAERDVLTVSVSTNDYEVSLSCSQKKRNRNSRDILISTSEFRLLHELISDFSFVTEFYAYQVSIASTIRLSKEEKSISFSAMTKISSLCTRFQIISYFCSMVG